MQQENMETNNEQQERSDEFLNEVNGTLNNVAENLRGLISDLNAPPSGVGIAPELARLQNETQTLRDNLEFLIGPFLNGARKGLLNLRWYDVAMNEGISELEVVKTKYANLQREWDSQQEHLGKLQGEVFKLRNQLQHQTSFCASLGSIMGNLVWKASRVPNVIDTLLAGCNNGLRQEAFALFISEETIPSCTCLNRGGDKLSEFCSIVTGTLVSFMETYNREFPDQKTDEMQFILSLAGTVANIAASPDGRHFLASDQNGKELLDQVINILPHIPHVSGDALKRILLMALYNLSINQNGLLMLQDQQALLVTIQRNMKNDRTPELKLMSLRLLQSITYEITSLKILQNMLQQIPLETVRTFTTTADAEIRMVAQDVVSNLEKAIKNLTDKPPSQDKVSYNECYMMQNFPQQTPSQEQIQAQCQAQISQQQQQQDNQTQNGQQQEQQQQQQPSIESNTNPTSAVNSY